MSSQGALEARCCQPPTKAVHLECEASQRYAIFLSVQGWSLADPLIPPLCTVNQGFYHQLFGQPPLLVCFYRRQGWLTIPKPWLACVNLANPSKLPLPWPGFLPRAAMPAPRKVEPSINKGPTDQGGEWTLGAKHDSCLINTSWPNKKWRFGAPGLTCLLLENTLRFGLLCFSGRCPLNCSNLIFFASLPTSTKWEGAAELAAWARLDRGPGSPCARSP